MSLLRRAPRQVYRVYEADEFLDGGDGGPIHGDAPLTAEAAGVEDHETRGVNGGRARRTATVMLIVIGVGSACGVIVARHMPGAHTGYQGPASRTELGISSVATSALPVSGGGPRPRHALRRLRPAQALATGAHRSRDRAAAGAQASGGFTVRRLVAAVDSSPAAAAATGVRSVHATEPGVPSPTSAALEFGFEH